MIKAGIDIGESAVRLVTEEDGLVFDERCLAALDHKGSLLAIGQEAADLKGSPGIQVVSPFQEHTINYEILDLILAELFAQFKLLRLFTKTVLVLSYPTWMKEADREELKDHLMELGLWRVYFDQEIWISAIGAGLDLRLPVYSCVMNLGGGSSDIAVFAHGQVQAKAITSGLGVRIRTLISNWLMQEKEIYVSEETLELVIRRLGSVKKRENPLMLEIEGIDCTTGNKRLIGITENDTAEALRPLPELVAEWVRRFLNHLDGEVQEDIRMRGIICCGGIFCLYGLSDRLQDLLDMPCHVTEDPAKTVCAGLEILINRLD